MPHLDARSGTICLHSLTQEVRSFMWVKGGVPCCFLSSTAEPWISLLHSVSCMMAERRFYTLFCPLQLCHVGLLAGRTHKFSRQKVPAQSLLPTTCPRNNSIPGRRSHPATFQDTGFLSFQSKGLGMIDELQCNKYFQLQNSPGRRGYRPTRVETEIVNLLPRVLVLGESVVLGESIEIYYILMIYIEYI